MKQITASIFFLCACFSSLLAQTQIQSNYFGINYWMPYKYINPNPPTGTVINGAIEYKHMQALVHDANAGLVRIGGNGYDEKGTANGNAVSNNDYLAAIAAVKAVNPAARFLIQIPFEANVFSIGNTQWITDLVDNIQALHGSDIFYYSIGNEWDNYKTATGNRKLYSSSQIKTFITAYATAIKDADNRILIVGPSVTSYWGTDTITNGNQHIISRLLDPNSPDNIIGTINKPGFPSHGKYILDVVDYHTYAGGPGGNMYNISSSDWQTERNACIAYPSGGFANEISLLKTKLATANANRASSPLTFAITEMNITWKNPSGTSGTNPWDNTFEGIGCRSFFAGQYWADMFSSLLKNSGNTYPSFVMPWSIHESGGDGDPDDLGMTRGTATVSITPSKLSTYYHYEMLADNFKCLSQYKEGTTNTSLKVFGGYNSTLSKYAVVILNQTTIYWLPPPPATQCTLRLDGTSVGTNWAKMSITGAPTTAQTIVDVHPSSTIVLIFDANGTLSRKIEYKQSDGVNGKPVYTTYNSNVTMAELGPDRNAGNLCFPSSTVLTSTPNMGAGSTYEWSRSVTAGTFTVIPGATSYQYTASIPAIYRVKVTKNGCTAEDYVTVYNCTNPDSPAPRFAENNIIDKNGSILSDNVPNPTNGRTAINFALAEDVSNGEIRIVDMFGKLIETIPVLRGSNSVEFNCSNCANGIYFYSLIANGEVLDTKKMIIAK